MKAEDVCVSTPGQRGKFCLVDVDGEERSDQVTRLLEGACSTDLQIQEHKHRKHQLSGHNSKRHNPSIRDPTSQISSAFWPRN